MSMRASGPFKVKMEPQTDGEASESLGRMLLDKEFHGDLEATSRGQMLTAMTSIEGSAGYVAIEQVSGALAGRKGMFALQHSGVMTRGVQQLTIKVVPDSGTGELEDLAGEMSIDIIDGQHTYHLEYTL